LEKKEYYAKWKIWHVTRKGVSCKLDLGRFEFIIMRDAKNLNAVSKLFHPSKSLSTK